MRLTAKFTPAFVRDLKRLDRKHVDDAPLREVIELILQNTPESIETLKRRHRMHTLSGSWAGSNECHIANIGDWLLIWMTGNDVAVLQRTGTHDDLFR